MADTVYESDPQAAPDSEFVAGELALLCVGNRGRLLDARRTPITVVDVSPERGAFVVRVDAFEDAGTRWELALDEIGGFQLRRDARRVAGEALAALTDSRARFDRDLVIEGDRLTRRTTLHRLDERRAQVRRWLQERAADIDVDLSARIRVREGHPALYELLDHFATERGVAALERDFTETFVSNPRSGEVVNGHAIVLAELGLCPFRGKAPRDPGLFSGELSRERRAEHLLWRLAFTAELWRRYGPDDVVLYRATASDGPRRAQGPSSFVSATFSRDVAEAHFSGGPTTRSSALWRQRLPLERLLMTFLETRAMNVRFREAEAVLIADPDNAAF